MNVTPYLFFDGRCNEALAYYAQALGAEVTAVLRFSDGPGQLPPGMTEAQAKESVMHASLRVGETEIFVSDGMCGGDPSFRGVSLAIGVASEGEADRVFAALAEGGAIQMPLDKTFFSPRFGVVADRFGVSWMVVTNP
jgi:PhnB protein